MARPVQELKEAIANLEQILDSGATTVSVDGNTTVFNLEDVRKRLNELKNELRQAEGKSNRRPLFNSIDLS